MIDLREIAIEYHKKCDEYDNMVCTGFHKDFGYMPIDDDERRKITKNANMILDNLVSENPQFSRNQIQRSISEYNMSK